MGSAYTFRTWFLIKLLIRFLRNHESEPWLLCTLVVHAKSPVHKTRWAGRERLGACGTTPKPTTIGSVCTIAGSGRRDSGRNVTWRWCAHGRWGPGVHMCAGKDRRKYLLPCPCGRGASHNTVYLGFLGTRLRGHPDILRLTTRGLLRCRRGGRSSCRISRQKTTKVSACFLGGKSRARGQ